ncbi:MAG: SPFH domain-containing protein [Candidatus Hodarchaeota archaeon]
MAQIKREGGFLRRLSLKKENLEKWFKGKKILSWERKDQAILVQKIQNELQESDGFLVKEYEMVVLVHEGQILELAYPGVYEIQKVCPGEVVWLSREEISIKWGTKARSLDQVSFGAHGAALFRIIAPDLFLLNFAQFLPELVLTQSMFKEKIHNSLCQSFINAVSSYELESLLRENYLLLEDKIRITFQDLSRWGLVLLTIGIMGYDIPPSYQSLFEKAIQKQLIAAKNELQRERLKGELESQKLKHEVAVEMERAKIKLEAERLREVERPRKEGEAQDYLIQREGDALVESAKTKSSIEDQKTLLEDAITQADIALAFGKITEEKHTEVIQRLKKRLKRLSEQIKTNSGV